MGGLGAGINRAMGRFSAYERVDAREQAVEAKDAAILAEKAPPERADLIGRQRLLVCQDGC